MAGFCDSSQDQKNNTQYVDPLGPSSGGNGAPQLRGQLFDYLSQNLGNSVNSGQTYANALTAAAANPAWQTVQGNAQKSAAGDYLNGSPQLDSAMAQNVAQAQRGAADENARIRSTFAKNGMAFSTADEQAQQTNSAAANAQAANTNAQTYLQNYLSERGNQVNAGNALAQGQQAPLSYLSSIPGAYTNPLTTAGGLVSGMASGGQMITTGTSGQYSPSAGSDVMNGLGSL